MHSFENNIALAERAAERGDWDEAFQYWAVVAQEAPLLPIGWIGASQALIALGRPDEADAVLVSAAERFPNDAATMGAPGHSL